jgi:hypothetical protein
MKKIICFFLFLLSIHCLQAQIQAGLKLATGSRMLLNNDDSDIGTGWQAGFAGKIHISKTISLRPFLGISRKGYFYSQADWFSGSEVMNQRLTYVDFLLPVSFKISNMFFIQAGVQAGYLTGARVIYKVEGGFINPGTDYFAGDILSEMNRFDYGLLTGMGIQANEKISVDLLANYGLPDVLKKKWKGYTTPLDGNNFSVMLGISYIFDLYKKK